MKFNINLSIAFITLLIVNLYSMKISETYSFQEKGHKLKIRDIATNETSTIYGHPLGIIQVEFFVNDSIVIISSGCCESYNYFKIDLKRKRAWQLFHNNFKDIQLKKWFTSLHRITNQKALVTKINANTKSILVNFPNLIWEDSNK